MMINVLSAILWAMSLYDTFMTIYVVMTWIPGLYKTKVFAFFEKGSSFFLKPFYGKIIVGRFDLSVLLAFIAYSYATRCLSNYIYFLTELISK